MLIDIVNEQVKTEQVYLCIINDSFEQKILSQIDSRVHICCLNRTPGSRNPVPLIKLNLWLLSKRFDVIHTHNLGILPLIVLSTSHIRIATVHALHVSLEHARRANCLFAISEAVRDDVLERLPSANVKVIMNGIKVDSIQQRQVQHYTSNRTFRIIQVARLDAMTKGQDILIRAIAILKKEGINNIQVDFIGEGTSRIELEKLTIENNVVENVRFLGLRDRAYIYSHLKDYDLMCHPARYEGFGLVIAEAMAARVPVLVSNDGGPYELIHQGKYGSSFRMESAEDCAEQIKTIMQEYAVAMEKVELAYQYTIQNFSIEYMVKQLLESYAKLV
jgi:glycosyltransferase involved in cell wall biosynthesis